MARHETEMHRQRRELLAALRQAVVDLEAIASRAKEPLIANFATICARSARDKIAMVPQIAKWGAAELFGDRSQMDLQDRKDV